MTIVNPLFPWGQLLYIWFSDLYHCQKKLFVPQPLYTHREIIKTPLLHQSLGPMSFFLSFSVSFSPWLILWSSKTCLAHSLAWASKTLSRRRPMPSPLLERAPSAFVRDASPVSRALLVFLRKPGSISLSLSFTFLSSPPDRHVLIH